jgi:hypothetical protein
MPQAWSLAHFSSQNALQHGIFHEACSARLTSNPHGIQRGRREGDAMQALMVTIKIKAGHRDAFMEALLSDARGSVHDEPGCFRTAPGESLGSLAEPTISRQGRESPCPACEVTWKCQVAYCLP